MSREDEISAVKRLVERGPHAFTQPEDIKDLRAVLVRLETERWRQQCLEIMSIIAAAGTPAVPQGRCEMTLTERFEYPDCCCGTYEGNLGPCKTFEEGAAKGRCVYCDHGIACHEAIRAPLGENGDA